MSDELSPESVYSRNTLITMHNAVLEQSGLSHDNLEFAFGKVLWKDIKVDRVDDFKEYFHTLSRPRGHLRDLFDYTRQYLVPNLRDPFIPFSHVKGEIFWCMSSFAVASSLASKASTIRNPFVSLGDMKRASFVFSDPKYAARILADSLVRQSILAHRRPTGSSVRIDDYRYQLSV